MKKTWVWVSLCFLALGVNQAQAAEEEVLPAYGDLYDVQWCPCNPEEQFNENGAVVMGRTVMCPCDGMYSGYKKGFDEDIRDFKNSANQKLRAFNYFKYYIGMDYNLSSPSTVSGPIRFNDFKFASGDIEVPSDSIFDDQDNLAFVAGARVSKYFGLEAFYLSSYDDNTSTQIDRKILNNTNYYLLNDFTTSYTAYGVDLIGYLPVNPYFDFLASLGIAQYNFDNTANFAIYNLDSSKLVEVVSKDFSEDKVAWRAALGGQLNIADGIALRAMYRYISIGGDYIDDISEVSLGVRFLF